MDEVKLSLDEIHDLAARALMANGADQRNADATAANMTLAEKNGCKSHGIFRVPGYVKSLKAGKINGKADPKVERSGSCVVSVAVRDDGSRHRPVGVYKCFCGHAVEAFWPYFHPLLRRHLCAVCFRGLWMLYVRTFGWTTVRNLLGGC